MWLLICYMVTSVGYVHLYDFAVGRNASWDLQGYPWWGAHRKTFFKMGFRTKKFKKPSAIVGVPKLGYMYPKGSFQLFTGYIICERIFVPKLSIVTIIYCLDVACFTDLLASLQCCTKVRIHYWLIQSIPNRSTEMPIHEHHNISLNVACSEDFTIAFLVTF